MGGESATEEDGTAPRWLQVRFGQLWENYSDEQDFSLTEASEILNESKEVVAVILSRLRKIGWLTLKFDEENFRKSKYKLVNPSTIFKKIAVEAIKNAPNHKN